MRLAVTWRKVADGANSPLNYNEVIFWQIDMACDMKDGVWPSAQTSSHPTNLPTLDTIASQTLSKGAYGNTKKSLSTISSFALSSPICQKSHSRLIDFGGLSFLLITTSNNTLYQSKISLERLLYLISVSSYRSTEFSLSQRSKNEQ